MRIIICLDSKGKQHLGNEGLVLISETKSTASFQGILRECGYVTKSSQNMGLSSPPSSFSLSSPRSCHSEDEGNLSARATRVRLEDIVGTSCLQSPRVSVAGSSISSRRNERPKLYQWCPSSGKWDCLYSYEDDDLSSNELFILDGEKTSFVWCGKHYPTKDKEKLQSIVNSFRSGSPCSGSSNSSATTPITESNPKRRIFVHETEESDEFWELFEEGF